MVLRRRADHRRTAYVNLLNRLFKRYAFACDRLLKRIEVDDNKVYGFDIVFAQLLQVERIVCGRKDAGMNSRMERFHATIQYFGKTGNLGNRADADFRILESLIGAAG